MKPSILSHCLRLSAAALACCLLLSAPLAQGAQGIKDLTLTGTTTDGSAHNNTGAHTFLSGASAIFNAGSALTLNGTLAGTPTGGTLSLTNVTLTLPASVVTSAQILDGTILNADINAAAAIAWTKLDKTGSSLADLTTRSATDLTSGTLPDARFPATLPALSGANLTALNATQLTSGTVPLARLSGLTTTQLSASAGILNAQLANSAITIAGTSTSLGGSITLDTIDNALAANGLIVRTAANTRAARTLTGTAGNVSVTNGDGVSGNPTLSLPTALSSINSITAAASTDFVANGGSSGASLTLGQGAAGVVTFNRAAAITFSGSAVSAAGTYTDDFIALRNTSTTNGTGSRISFTSSAAVTFAAIEGVRTTDSTHTGDLLFRTGSNASPVPERMRLVSTGNLLIGTTTDITGSGGLHVAGTTAATSATTGAFRVGTGIGMGGGVIYASSLGAFGGALSAGGTTSSANITSNYTSALVDGFASRDTNTGGKTWVFGAGTGSVSTFGFRNVTDSFTALTLGGAAGTASTFATNLTVSGTGQNSFGASFTPTAWGVPSIDVNGASGGLVAVYYGGTPKGYLLANSGNVALNSQGANSLLLRTNGSTAVTVSSSDQSVSFASTTSGTSTTAAAILGKSMGLAENLFVGGYVSVAGNTPSPTADGQGYLGSTSAQGFILQGRGSTNDFNFYNKSGSSVLSNPTGTQNVTAAGNLTVSGATEATTGGAGSLATAGGIYAAKAIVTSTHLEGVEQASAPAAPAANGFKIYAKDNGAGKTVLYVRFASGAEQQIAIEP